MLSVFAGSMGLRCMTCHHRNFQETVLPAEDKNPFHFEVLSSWQSLAQGESGGFRQQLPVSARNPATAECRPRSQCLLPGLSCHGSALCTRIFKDALTSTSIRTGSSLPR